MCFGKEVQLQHYISKEFVEATVNTSTYDKSTYRVRLGSKYSAGMLFKFIPKYKLRVDGQDIEFKDQLLIYSPDLKCYLNYSYKIEGNIHQIDLDRCISVDYNGVKEEKKIMDEKQLTKQVQQMIGIQEKKLEGRTRYQWIPSAILIVMTTKRKNRAISSRFKIK